MNFFYQISNLFFLGMLLSFMISIFILLTIGLHKDFTVDRNVGIQKIHVGNIPRIGGISIFFAITCIIFFIDNALGQKIEFFILCATPVFLIGIAEDLTKMIRPKWRLVAAFLTAILLVTFFNVKITETGLEIIDLLLDQIFIVFLISILAVTFMTQAMNIIDGLNGLSMGTSVVMLIAVILISLMERDIFIFNFSLIINFLFFAESYI